MASRVGDINEDAWSAKEDAKLVKFVEKHGPREWQLIAKNLPGRIPKHCRQRWENNFDPNINTGPWTEKEEKMILFWHKWYKGKWALVAIHLPGRTDVAIEKHFNDAKLKDRIMTTPVLTEQQQGRNIALNNLDNLDDQDNKDNDKEQFPDKVSEEKKDEALEPGSEYLEKSSPSNPTQSSQKNFQQKLEENSEDSESSSYSDLVYIHSLKSTNKSQENVPQKTQPTPTGSTQTCPKCNSQCKNLTRHLKYTKCQSFLTQKERKFKCTPCNKYLGSEGSLKSHLRVYHGILSSGKKLQKLQCSQCEYSSYNAHMIARHSKSHAKKMKKLKKNSQIFQTSPENPDEDEEEEEEDFYEEFENDNNDNSYSVKKPQEEIILKRCSCSCGERFDLVEELKSHLITEHNVIPHSDSGKQNKNQKNIQEIVIPDDDEEEVEILRQIVNVKGYKEDDMEDQIDEEPLLIDLD